MNAALVITLALVFSLPVQASAHNGGDIDEQNESQQQVEVDSSDYKLDNSSSEAGISPLAYRQSPRECYNECMAGRRFVELVDKQIAHATCISKCGGY